MNLIKSNTNQCLLASFAMVLETTTKTLTEELGHDGKDIVSRLIEPYCYRSFHPQEFTDVCFKRGKSLVLIEKYPKLMHGTELIDHSSFMDPDRFDTYLEHTGVLCGTSNRVGHAVALIGGKVYDPRGYVYKKLLGFHNLEPLYFLMVV